MKKFFFIIVSILLFFTGCGIKKAFTFDPVYEKTLKYTQRGQIINSLETKALIDAIYLNPLYQEKFKNPTFLIGIYNDYNNRLITNEFNLTLNFLPPTDINSTIPSFIRYKDFPFYNEWMKYYLVQFKNEAAPFILKYKSKNWGEVKFTFQ